MRKIWLPAPADRGPQPRLTGDWGDRADGVARCQPAFEFGQSLLRSSLLQKWHGIVRTARGHIGNLRTDYNWWGRSSAPPWSLLQTIVGGVLLKQSGCVGACSWLLRRPDCGVHTAGRSDDHGTHPLLTLRLAHACLHARHISPRPPRAPAGALDTRPRWLQTLPQNQGNLVNLNPNLNLTMNLNLNQGRSAAEHPASIVQLRHAV